MFYSIGEISKMFHLPIHTLRYYDSCGLFPFIKRDDHDNRYFEEKDLKLIRSICCLKDSNMPLKEIRNYIDLYMEGNQTLEKRCQIFYAHKEKLLKQIHDLEESMMVMDKTINNYSIAIDEYHHSLECASLECKHSEECKHAKECLHAEACNHSMECKHSTECYKTDQDKSSYRPISERVNASLDNSLMITENVEMSR